MLASHRNNKILMAVITLYKVTVDLDALEHMGMKVTKSMYNKYKDPVYTESMHRAFLIRLYYGSDFVDVKETEVAVEWEQMDWSKTNGMNAVAIKSVK